MILKEVCSTIFRTGRSSRAYSIFNMSHMEKTKGSPRNKQISAAEVVNIQDISPTVKLVDLHIRNQALSFKPGQWVDFIIPGVSTVGGFSMVSAPNLLEERRQLQLAIKYSSHPPAHWVHTQCKTGSEVFVKVGGNFHYIPSKSELENNTLLIAGGVGINPLYSMLRHICHMHSLSENKDIDFGESLLLFSAKTNEELIFKDQLSSLTSQSSIVSCKYFVTQQKDDIYSGRINQGAIEEALDRLQKNKKPITSFLCGPQRMMGELETILMTFGLKKSDIRYESWW